MPTEEEFMLASEGFMDASEALGGLFVETIDALDAAPLLGGLVTTHVTSEVQLMAGAARDLAKGCRSASLSAANRVVAIRRLREVELRYRSELADYESSAAAFDAEVALMAEGLLEAVSGQAPVAPTPPPPIPLWADLGLGPR